MRRFKKNRVSIIILVLLVVSVGYALVSTQLGINGTFNVARTKFDVHWVNPVVTSGSVSNTLPNIGQDSGAPANTKLSWSATFNVPGDFYEFTVDAENSGTIDAMITGINMKVNNTDINSTPSPLPSYIKYELIYDNGDPVVEGIVLKAESDYNPRIKYKVRVEYDAEKATAATVNAIPTNGVTYNFNLLLTYAKADKENATVVYGCPGPKCVYTLNENNSKVGQSITDYTYDYTSLNRRFFLGVVIDKNNIILSGFSCGVEKGRVFCINGLEEQSNNRIILEDAYKNSEDGCYDADGGVYSFKCDGDDINAQLEKSGSADVCDINSTECCKSYEGYIYCME